MQNVFLSTILFLVSKRFFCSGFKPPLNPSPLDISLSVYKPTKTTYEDVQTLG